MWDTVGDTEKAYELTHDLPCVRCGHAMHTFLACSDSCACLPCLLPGAA